MRQLSVTSAALFGLLSVAFAQDARFEVVSIRPSLSPSDFVREHGLPRHVLTAGRVELQVESLTRLILEAYGLDTYQLSGPEWMDTARFDVAAKPPAGASTAQLAEMLRTLLAERFKLTVHHEEKTKSTYALVIGRGGSKVKPAASRAPVLWPNTDGWIVTRRAMNDDGTLLALTSTRNRRARLDSPKINMKQLARILQDYVEDPVVEMTGLEGDYEITLEVPEYTNARGKMLAATGGDAQGDGAEPGGVSIFRSVESLGLMLEHRKGPVDVLVVDHVERSPTEN